jgi:hypothetical protein
MMDDVRTIFRKKDDRRRRSYSDLKFAFDKFNEEFVLLQEISEIISKGNEPVTDQSLRDAFMVHFRKVHHFTYPKDPSDEVIIAEDFFETKQKWASSRVKESELITSAAMLASNEILGLSLGKTKINEKDKDYFLQVIEDFKEVVQQFVEMTLPSDAINKVITESDSLESTYEVGEEHKEVIKQYGVNKVLYETVRGTDGILEVHVLHSNKNVREKIKKNRNNPAFFLENVNSYKDNDIRALKWLADIVIDNRSYFKEQKVKFILPDD